MCNRNEGFSSVIHKSHIFNKNMFEIVANHEVASHKQAWFCCISERNIRVQNSNKLEALFIYIYFETIGIISVFTSILFKTCIFTLSLPVIIFHDSFIRQFLKSFRFVIPFFDCRFEVFRGNYTSIISFRQYYIIC